MGLFDIFSGGSPNLAKEQEDAFRREQERLRKLQIKERKQAAFLTTEGKGISEAAEFSLGDELDLEDLTDEKREARATGRIEPTTGLIL